MASAFAVVVGYRIRFVISTLSVHSLCPVEMHIVHISCILWLMRCALFAVVCGFALATPRACVRIIMCVIAQQSKPRSFINKVVIGCKLQFSLPWATGRQPTFICTLSSTEQCRDRARNYQVHCVGSIFVAEWIGSGWKRALVQWKWVTCYYRTSYRLPGPAVAQSTSDNTNCLCKDPDAQRNAVSARPWPAIRIPCWNRSADPGLSQLQPLPLHSSKLPAQHRTHYENKARSSRCL